ncbi:hypothetical protein [Treponema sp.]|uniref:hypothetical protein n=1 Tax=Treponema sp. TaxID=166 RepID=UPI00298DA50D|nr:hypothetical protein [Treponema sp.]MCQ2240831.1 hypothetical protein [Treponema sp.]
MKKIILLFLFALTSAIAFTESYKVSNTIGKVYSKTPNGEWKKIKEDAIITDETVIKIEDKSSIGFISGTKKITIRGPKENSVNNLIIFKKSSVGAIKKNKINKGSVAKSNDKTSKGISVAAARASESQGDTVWEEE